MNKQNTPLRMPKALALALLRKVKRGIMITSILSFGTFSALAMNHTLGTTAQQTTAATTVIHKITTVTPTTKKTTTAAPAATATKETTTVTPTATTTQQGGGYGFGSSNSTSKPVSGSHTS